jgi:hypothetical protein
MPLFATADIPASLCAAIDWDRVTPARHALTPEVLRERATAGTLPEHLVPISCVKGKFRPGRFVDDDGNVYRLHDAVGILEEVPEARPAVNAYRHARRVETATVAVAIVVMPTALWAPFLVGPILPLATGVPAANAAGSARTALARAVTAYNAAHFWERAEADYTVPDASIPASAVRATELVLGERDCSIAHDDPAFLTNAQDVLGYAGKGYDVTTLIRAVDASPVAGCDLHAVIEAGLPQVVRAKPTIVEVPDAPPSAVDPPLPTLLPLP